MNNIQIFKHEMFGEIRTMTDEKGETFFVGNDVAKALGYSDSEKQSEFTLTLRTKGWTKWPPLEEPKRSSSSTRADFTP